MVQESLSNVVFARPDSTTALHRSPRESTREWTPQAFDLSVFSPRIPRIHRHTRGLKVGSSRTGGSCQRERPHRHTRHTAPFAWPTPIPGIGLGFLPRESGSS